jgi:alpha-glucosidase (family GH31 glycosyl hydrolase)
MLSRAAWAGFQTTGAVLWSSDIPSTFESLQVSGDQRHRVGQR